MISLASIQTFNNNKITSSTPGKVLRVPTAVRDIGQQAYLRRLPGGAQEAGATRQVCHLHGPAHQPTHQDLAGTHALMVLLAG